MINRDTILRFRNSSILKLVILTLACIFPSNTWADGRPDADYFEKGNLTQREKCEIIASHASFAAEGMKKHSCNQHDLFRPIRSLISPAYDAPDMEAEISLSATKDDDWPLQDILIKTKSNSGSLTIDMVSINNSRYDLFESMPEEKHGFSAIHIGFVGEVILIRLEHQSITQFAITPTYCENGDVDLNISQVFSWYPPFQEDSYSKSYFTSPSCI